jgi:hypothetical protein
MTLHDALRLGADALRQRREAKAWDAAVVLDGEAIAIDREHADALADAEALAALADSDDDPTVEDRILAGETDRGVVAAVVAGASDAENLRVLAAAAEILADLVRDDVVRLSSRDLSAIREALRLDYATPI